MSYARPTLTQLRNQVAADIASNLKGADGLLRFSNMGVTGRAQADLANGHYGYIDYIALQAVPFTATDEYLDAWAALKGVTREPAVAWVGQWLGIGTSGTDIPAGTLIARGDGAEFLTMADAVISGGTVTVQIQATVPGALSQTDAGTVLTLGQAIANVQSAGTAGTTTTPAADLEIDDSLRSRMLQVYAAPPQGGDRSDYVEWALAVPGVTRAWVAPNGAGAGTVVVYTMFDVTEAAHGGFPQGSNGVATNEPRAAVGTGDQLAVANAIFPDQPVTALVYSVAPTANMVNFTISGLSSASSATKAAIAAAITAVFLRQGGPGGTLDGSGNAQGTVDLSYVNSAIAAISGTAGFVVTSPTTNIVSATGELPTLGAVTYT